MLDVTEAPETFWRGPRDAFAVTHGMTAFSGAFSVFYADPRKKGESIKRKEKEEESKKKREEEEESIGKRGREKKKRRRGRGGEKKGPWPIR